MKKLTMVFVITISLLIFTAPIVSEEITWCGEITENTSNSEVAQEQHCDPEGENSACCIYAIYVENTCVEMMCNDTCHGYAQSAVPPGCLGWVGCNELYNYYYNYCSSYCQYDLYVQITCFNAGVDAFISCVSED